MPEPSVVADEGAEKQHGVAALPLRSKLPRHLERDGPSEGTPAEAVWTVGLNGHYERQIPRRDVLHASEAVERMAEAIIRGFRPEGKNRTIGRQPRGERTVEEDVASPRVDKEQRALLAARLKADDQRRREQRCTQIGQIEKLPFLLGVELRDGLAHVAAPSPTPKAGTVYAVEQTPFAPVGSLPVNPTSLQSVNARLVVLRRRVP